MKLGFGLYRHQLDDDHFQFARQCGATHLVVHLVDYFHQGGNENPRDTQPTGGLMGWGRAGNSNPLWTVEQLLALRLKIEKHGLTFYAIENFDPAHWHDILLDGPARGTQMETIRQIVRNVGEAGIPVIGYNFSIAGVFGRTTGTYARGGAESVGQEGEPPSTLIPQGMVWNMRYRDELGPGVIEPFSHEELWRRFKRFLDDVLPDAERAGVRLALHPDDPPMPTIRGTPRLVYQPRLYDRVLDLNPSPSNQLEYCLGTLTEMSEAGAQCEGVYQALDRHSARGALAYVHVRNVHGRVPHYQETFLDDGDLSIPRALSILKKNNFQGVIIPDHAPSMKCPAPWHAGMAYAMGYLKSILDGD
jgi:mannonate dehydratase